MWVRGDSGEDLGEELANKSKQVYLTTFPHPVEETAQDGTRLKAPSSYSKRQILEAIVDVVEKTQGPRLAPLRLELMCLFREKHQGGDLHDHVALLADRCFRFLPLKRQLLRDYGLASHWSCTHNGYHSCVAYGHLPSPPKKMRADLDPSPEMWAPEGKQHPCLEEASRASVTAAATAATRAKHRQACKEKGKEEKFTEVDVWPVVIRENIEANAEAPEVLMAYAKRCGGQVMVNWCFKNWAKLPELIARSWQVKSNSSAVQRNLLLSFPLTQLP